MTGMNSTAGFQIVKETPSAVSAIAARMMIVEKSILRHRHGFEALLAAGVDAAKARNSCSM